MSTNSPAHAAAESTPKAQPVRNTQLILVAVGVIATALQGISWATHPSWQSVLGTVASALFTAFSGYLSQWLPGLVVPLEDAAVYIDQHGNSVAGPAAAIPNGKPATAVQTDKPLPL